MCSRKTNKPASVHTAGCSSKGYVQEGMSRGRIERVLDD